MVTELSWPFLISFMISFILPLLVGLVTKWSTNPALKSVLLLLLSTVTAFLTELLTHVNNQDTFSWKLLVLNAIFNFVIAVAAHFGLWKPTNVTAKVQSSLVKDLPPAG